MKFSEKFEAAKFYAIGDSEVLTCTDWEEAVGEYIAGICDLDDEATIAKMCPVIVVAFKPKVYEPGFGDFAVVRMLEYLREMWTEVYGSYEFDSGELDTDSLGAPIMVLVEEHLKSAEVWQCDKVSEHVFSFSEVWEMVN